MLASSFAFIVQNGVDQIVDASIVIRPWKFSDVGALEYRGAQTPLTVAPAANDDATTTAYDNSTNLDLGAHLDITLTPQLAGTGTVVVYLITNNGDQKKIALVSQSWAAALDARISNAEI